MSVLSPTEIPSEHLPQASTARCHPWSVQATFSSLNNSMSLSTISRHRLGLFSWVSERLCMLVIFSTRTSSLIIFIHRLVQNALAVKFGHRIVYLLSVFLVCNYWCHSLRSFDLDGPYRCLYLASGARRAPTSPPSARRAYSKASACRRYKGKSVAISAVRQLGSTLTAA